MWQRGDYYDKKREQAKSAERENIREYIRSLNEKMVKWWGFGL